MYQERIYTIATTDDAIDERLGDVYDALNVCPGFQLTGVVELFVV